MDELLELLFPKVCVGCNRVGEYLCDNCRSKIQQSDLVCPICERPAIGGVTHPLCKKPNGLDGLWSLGVYHGSLRKLIQKLKYRFVKDLAEELADLVLWYWSRHTPVVLDQIKRDYGKNWLVVSVPLHKMRLNWRGFNQADLLGSLVAQKIGINYLDCLERVRSTKTQVGLLSYDRKRNIKGAFEVKDAKLVADKNILLWDDVWTTGSTLKECGLILKKSGAKKVWAITLAR